ncbi:MAG: ISC system 2Fe-2S type ferredoxin [Candidatus Zeuxoniibacter abyssi]|nr:MAG: ISC system 2Fe-2S type ferredoxin [Candidatus Persebacteraceae bacterium AB1(2)]
MPILKVLSHEDLCPAGTEITVVTGISVCDALLNNNIDIEHACEKSCACTTCHVIVRAGIESLNEADDMEEDLLDKAWGLEPESRLSCQAIVGDVDLTVEIPKYTINHAKEEH